MNGQISPSSKKTNYSFWFGFFGVIVLFALVVTFSEFKGSQQISNFVDKQEKLPMISTVKPSPMSIVQLIISDKSVSVSEEKFASLPENISDKVKEFGDKSIMEFEQHINNDIDNIFSHPIDKIPNFADWYYSLSGEYSRILNTVSGDMAEYMVSKMQETVFQPANFEYRVDKLVGNLNEKVFDEFKNLQTSVVQEIENFLEVNMISTENRDVNIKASVNLSEAFSKAFRITKNDINILSATALTTVGIATGGKALGAVVMKSLIPKLASKKAVQMAVALLAKLAVKAGVKGGGALAAGGMGTLACAALGPFAAGCGAIAAIGVWLAVDKAYIEIDEIINRQDFEEEIREALTEQKNELKLQLINAYKNLLTQQYALIESQTKTSFKTPTRNFIPAEVINK